MEYKIIGSPDLYVVQRQVTELLQKGWSISGNLSVCMQNMSFKYYAQAMIKLPD